MNSKYEEWITRWLSDHKPHGMCYSASALISQEFPELRPVPGYVTCDQGMPAHWWCETPSGEIVDPTASQFTGITSYDEYEEGQEIRIGRCMNCGYDIYDNTMNSKKSTCACSPECNEELCKYVDDGGR